MAKARLLPRRRILRDRDGKTMSKPVPPPVYSTATQRIMELGEYHKIVEALRKGTTVPFIVRWFEKEGWLGNLSPSTLTQYLYKFKVERADLLTPENNASESYDALVGTRIPEVDEETELDKLILLQKRRLPVDVNTEINMGKLLDTTHKEVNALGELLKAKRLFRNGGTEAVNTVGEGNAALRELRVSESEQDKMQGLTAELFKAIKNASKKKAKHSQKARARA